MARKKYRPVLNKQQQKALDEYKAMLRSRQTALAVEASGSHVDVHVDDVVKAPVRLSSDPMAVAGLGLYKFYLDSKSCKVIDRLPNGDYLFLWEKKTGQKGNSSTEFPVKLYHPYLSFRVILGGCFLLHHMNGFEYHAGGDVYAAKGDVVYYYNYRYLSTEEGHDILVPKKYDKKIPIII